MYLGKKGYTIPKNILDASELSKIKKDLSVKPNVNVKIQGNSKVFPVYRESNSKIYIPRYYGEENYGICKNKKISDGDDININFNGNLYPYQENIVSKFVDKMKENNSGGGLLDIEPGKGKTVMGLAILSKLKKKTLVIVHKSFLLNQWKERIEQFIPDAKVGRIQGPTIDIEGKDIVIGMLQSLCKGNYPPTLFDCFGLSIYDECHHLSAEVFSNCMINVVTNYTIGLSGTMTRKDGLTKIFKWFIGPVIHKEHSKKDIEVLVKAVNYNVMDIDFNKEITDFKGNVMYSSMISKLCSYQPRTDFIFEIIKFELTKNKNQQIMILCHNKSFINNMFNILKENEYDVGLYLGGMKEEQLKESEKCLVILATYSMASEGLDIKTLTTLIMASPKSDVCQSVGRILRSKHSNPMVIDIIDGHRVFKNQWTKRLKYYNKQKYKVVYYTNDDYTLDENESKIKEITINDEDNGKKINNLVPKNKCLINI
jgi:superfamily II DNA or RNA helicase